MASNSRYASMSRVVVTGQSHPETTTANRTSGEPALNSNAFMRSATARIVQTITIERAQ
jgi:hypothetical protein